MSAVVRQAIAGPMGHGVKADIEITTYKPSTLYAFRAVEGPVRPVGSYRFVDAGGGSEVTFSLSAEVSGLKKVLISGPVQKSMDGEMAPWKRPKLCRGAWPQKVSFRTREQDNQHPVLGTTQHLGYGIPARHGQVTRKERMFPFG